MSRQMQEYGVDIEKQVYRIEVEHFPGNYRFDVQAVAELIRAHGAPLLSLTVHDVSPTPPFNPQTNDIVRGRGSGRLFRVLGRDGDLLWLRPTEKPGQDTIVRRTLDMGPTR